MKDPKFHYGAGLTWTHRGITHMHGRNSPVCTGFDKPEWILRMKPSDVTCWQCKRILRIAGLIA